MEKPSIYIYYTLKLYEKSINGRIINEDIDWLFRFYRLPHGLKEDILEELEAMGLMKKNSFGMQITMKVPKEILNMDRRARRSYYIKKITS